jgi:F0F1-type ATP synthase epsilon subunit
MLVRVVTKNGLALEKQVGTVFLPSVQGVMEVLPGHTGAVVLLSEGRVLHDGSSLRIAGGVAKVLDDEVLILAEIKQLN